MRLKLLITTILCLILSAPLFAQTSAPAYYVTIGVYGVHSFAIKFTDGANKKNFSAAYAINPSRKLYYVYIYSSTDRATAIAFMLKIRLETAYKDAWVFKGVLGEQTPGQPTVLTPVVTPPVVTPPVVTTPVEEPVKKDVTDVARQEFKKDSIAHVEKVAAAKADSIKAAKAAVKPEEKHIGNAFLFKLVNEESGHEVIGEVHVQESSRASQFQAFEGNKTVYIKAPTNSDGTYTVVTQVPGYKEVKTTFIYNDKTAARGDNNEIIIPFQLKRAKAGDYIDFNNVKFVRNSNIMTPESQPELDGLVSLMKENLRYEIKIHGHCNGTQDREIQLLGTSKNYFAMDPKLNKKETTSAKVLSAGRAEAVKDYLVDKGIDPSRITTKAEGGRIPLYGEESTLASYNDRVEIEIKKH